MSSPRKIKKSSTNPSSNVPSTVFDVELSSDSEDSGGFGTNLRPGVIPWYNRKSKLLTPLEAVNAKKRPPQFVVTPKVSRRTRKDGSSFTTTSTASPDMARGDFVDLSRDTGESLLLPGAPLYWLRNRHELYWSYDPRGNDDVTEDFRYCQFCKCPSHYCAEVMYGDICANHTEYLRVEMGSLVQVYDFYLKCSFTRTYTNLVHTKMMENSISFPAEYDFKKLLVLPKCMEDGSLKKLLKEYEDKEE